MPDPNPNPGSTPPPRQPAKPLANPHAVRSVEVIEETEIAKGWRYSIRVFWEGGRLTEHTAELNWSDHDHWSGGVCAPSRVIEAVVGVSAECLGTSGLPEVFNASSLRNLVPGLDDRARERL